MFTRTSFGAVLVGLLLVGAACAPAAQQPAPQPPTTATYTEPATGLTFDYPSAWGEVRVSRELPAMDTGKRLSFGFTENDRVHLHAVSADYSEGIGEGAPTYFTVRSPGSDPTSAADAARFLRQEFDILTWQRIGSGHFHMVHNGGLGGDALIVSHLLTAWKAPEGFSTLMVNARIGDFRASDGVVPAKPYTADDAAAVLADLASVELTEAVDALVRSIR